MGASAGTGVRSFSEGGSTSTPSSSAPTAPQRAIYQPQYTDYRAGLSATPQAQGPLASMLNMGSYGSQMPTFTRPQAPPPQAQYSIPYNNARSRIGFIGSLGRIGGNLFPGTQTSNEELAATLAQDINKGNLTEAQYNMMMKNPEGYLSYVQAVQAGETPTTLGYQAPPKISFMTQAERTRYNQRVQRELDNILRPITVFDVQDQGGS
jgi:hypothetical protein